MMDKILDFLARQVTVPIWVILVAFLVGLVISIIIKELLFEMSVSRRRRDRERLGEIGDSRYGI